MSAVIGRWTRVWLLAALFAASVSGCARPSGEDRALHAFEGPIMGTYYRVQVAGEELSEARKETLRGAIEEELEDVNARMSTYLPESELSRFNRHGDTAPFAVSEATFEVLEAALAIAEQTRGAFDVTVGPLVDAWGFGPESAQPPALDAGGVEELLGRVGFRNLSLDGASRSVRKRRGDVHCDLSGIAKGYAVDRVAERLAELGVADFWVEVGGEVRAAGLNAAGKAWRLGIERPLLARGAVQRIVALENLAVATSGDYRSYREIGGERYAHIIDPRTGWPIRHRLASVSVFHPRCMIADAWATALMVLGEEEGYELAARESLSVLFLVRQGEGFAERGTPAFWELAGGPSTGEAGPAPTRPHERQGGPAA